MQEVLVAGTGKIGTLIATLLALGGSYSVHVVDKQEAVIDLPLEDPKQAIKHLVMDFNDSKAHATLTHYIKRNEIGTIISSLPYFCNPTIAKIAKENNLNYFDITEDTKVTEIVRQIASDAKSAFVPQCGLAPGFITIVANDLIQQFDKIDTVLMRVGALPIHPNNILKYALTWSTDGLINEYGNPCFAIVNGQEMILQPLEGLETIEIDGLLYEAFNTSGGLGSLAKIYNGKVNTMNYKTLRYPGHCQYMKLLMNDLKLNNDRVTLKRILETALPRTMKDVIVIYVAVKGFKKGQLFEETYVKKVYPQWIADKWWTAIQITTAAGICSVVDIVLKHPDFYKGMVLQESIPLMNVLNNQFGQYYNQNTQDINPSF